MTDRVNKKPGRAELELELELLQRREALFDEAERFTHQGYFEWNIHRQRLESCSLNFKRIFNISVDSDLGLAETWEQVASRIHPHDTDRFGTIFEEAEGHGHLELEFRVSDAEGSSRFLRQIGIKTTQSHQGDVCLMAMVQDVTEQMIDEADPDSSDSFSQHVERITDIGSFIYDDFDDVYLYASPGCARIHGVSEAEFTADVESVDDDLKDVFAEDRGMVRQAYKEYFNSGEDCRLEYRIKRADGETRWVRELLVAVQLRPDGRVALSRGVMQDITDHKEIEMQLRQAKQNLEQLVAVRTEELANTVTLLQDEIEVRNKISAELEFLANHDPLTGLPSLRLCKDRLERALAEARRNQQLAAVMFLDLDGFKKVNDSYGHEFGDQVLKATANRIKAEIRETDTVARIGGDEFLVILAGLPGMQIAQRIASNLIQQVSQAIVIDHHQVAIGCSIGIALYPDDATDADELIRVADRAMYQIKKSGKNDFSFVQPRQLN